MDERRENEREVKVISYDVHKTCCNSLIGLVKCAQHECSTYASAFIKRNLSNYYSTLTIS